MEVESLLLAGPVPSSLVFPYLQACLVELSMSFSCLLCESLFCQTNRESTHTSNKAERRPLSRAGVEDAEVGIILQDEKL